MVWVTFGFHVGNGDGVGEGVGEWVIIIFTTEVVGDSFCGYVFVTGKVVVAAIPVLRACPVTTGFINKAIISTSTSAAIRYIISCLSMNPRYLLIFPA